MDDGIQTCTEITHHEDQQQPAQRSRGPGCSNVIGRDLWGISGQRQRSLEVRHFFVFASFLLSFFLPPRPQRTDYLFDIFKRPKCPVPPKPFPQMERITTASSRTTDPTSFLTGKIQCGESGPTGKSVKT